MGKRKYDRIIGIVTSINCSGTHYRKIGYTDILGNIGETITYIDDDGKEVDTGEKIYTKDYVEDNSDATILNNKYILIWTY